MTDQTDTTASQDAARKIAEHARQWTRTVVVNIARETGMPVVTRPVVPGSRLTLQYAEHAAGIGIARQVELAARHDTRQYIRHAREAGLGWAEIGAALGITGGGEGVAESIAGAAFEYAAGPGSWNYDPSFTWTCQACGQAIHDRGLCNGPRDDERGHAAGCKRLAATLAAWDAQWADDEAEA